MTGTYDEGDYSDKYIRERMKLSNLVTAEDIAKKPKEYMVVLNFWYFNTLVDLKPENGLYIHSLSEPFDEEMEMSYDRMMNWLKYFKVNFVQSHCSGHINGTDLRKMIKTIRPKTLFPIHTEHPNMFEKSSMDVRIVQEGKKYSLAD